MSDKPDDEDEAALPPPFEMPSGDPVQDLRHATTYADWCLRISWASHGIWFSSGAWIAARHLKRDVEVNVELTLFCVAIITFAIGFVLSGFAYYARKREREKTRDDIRARFADARTTWQARLEQNWLPERCVAIHHWRAPSVTGAGKVEMFLRATNYSPFPVLLHSPGFFAHVNESSIEDSRAIPERLTLDPNGGSNKFTITSAMPPGIHLGQYAKVWLSGRVVVERMHDHVTANVHVVGESDGDWVKLVEVTSLVQQQEQS